MNKRTVWIIGAVVFVGGLIAFAGDRGPLHEQSTLACHRCTWDYVSVDVAPGEEVLAVQGPGMLHGVWFGRSGSGNARLEVWNGIPDSSDRIGAFHAFTNQSKFFQLDVTFESDLHLRGGSGGVVMVTVLYRR